MILGPLRQFLQRRLARFQGEFGEMCLGPKRKHLCLVLANVVIFEPHLSIKVSVLNDVEIDDVKLTNYFEVLKGIENAVTDCASTR